MNRRHFLKTTGTALALASFTPPLVHAARAPLARRSLKKAIMWDTVGVPGSVLAKFKAIKAAGFEGVEMASHMNQEEVLAARDAVGLVIPSVCGSQHWAKPLSHPDPAARGEGLEALRRTLQDAKRYGATSVLLVPGIVSDKVSYDACWKRSVEQIRKALPLAWKLRVKIAIENVWNNFLLSPLEAARYVDEFRSRMVGWHFDCGNILNYGWPEQWIRILGPRIVKLHIKEFSRKKADKQGKGAGFDVALLEGDVNWPATMKALDDIGYSGWAIAEQDGGDSPEGLKELAARLDRIIAS